VSAAISYPNTIAPPLHTPSSVLREYRESVCAELSAEHDRRALRILALGTAGLRDAETALMRLRYFERHSVTVLDEDPWRIAACKEEYGQLGIRYIEGLLDDPAFTMPGEYDLIYNLNGLAARADWDAKGWLSRILEVLAPGGRLVLATFTPEWSKLCREAGCKGGSPAFSRDEHLLTELITRLPAESFLGYAIWTDSSSTIACLELAK